MYINVWLCILYCILFATWNNFQNILTLFKLLILQKYSRTEPIFYGTSVWLISYNVTTIYYDIFMKFARFLSTIIQHIILLLIFMYKKLWNMIRNIISWHTISVQNHWLHTHKQWFIIEFIIYRYRYPLQWR